MIKPLRNRRFSLVKEADYRNATQIQKFREEPTILFEGAKATELS
jgi:hypothetical protein